MMVVSRFAIKPPGFCMVLLMLCTLLLMTASLSAVPHGNEQTIGIVTCSGEFVLYHNFCYRYFGHTHRPFHHAEKLCTRYQSSLVSIHSPHEEEFVVQLAENNTSFWIGLNDEDGPASHHKEGIFKWTDGNILTDAVSYQNWSPGEPSNRRHLDCVKASRKGWAMAQGGCAASRLPFVCKKQGCPAGFDWNGNHCDKTRDERKMAHPDWLFSSCTLFKVTITAILLTAVALISVTICSYTRTRRTSSRHQELYPT